MASKGPTRSRPARYHRKPKQKQQPSQKDQYSLMDILKQGREESLSFNLTVQSQIEVGLSKDYSGLPKPSNSIEQLEFLAKVESAFGSYGPHEAWADSNQCPKPKSMKELLVINGVTRHDKKNVRLSIEKPHEGKIDMKTEIDSRIKSNSELLATDKNGQTILHGAALNGAHELAEEVMRHEQEIALRDVVDMCDRTALHFAAMIGDERMVNVIVNDDENINVKKKDMFDQTPLYVAAENGHVEIVSMLIGLGGEPDSVDMLGNTPLFGAVRAQSSPTVKYLLAMEVSVNHRNRMRATPLQYAVLTGNVEVIRLLLDHKAEANTIERMERTPLMLVCIGEASMEQCTEIGKLLLEGYTAEDIHMVSRNGSQAIHYALRRKNIDLTNALMERGADIHSMDEYGFQPIHYAVDSENLDLTKSLIKLGANILAVSKSGYQPIHISAASGNCKVTEVLIKSGAHIDARHEIFLGTPLHFSVGKKHLHVLKLLLEAGANSEIKDINSETPLDIAVRQNNIEFVQLLKRHRSNKTAKKQIKQRAPPSEVAPSTPTDQPTFELDDGQPKTQQEEESTAKCDVLVPAKSEKDKHSTSTDQPTIDLDAELLKTQQEVESAAKCDAPVPAKSDKDKNKHLNPVMSKEEVDAMVNGMKELLEQGDPETLAECNIVLSRRNFAMAIIGPKGGDLFFADHSVTMKIPAGALSDTRVISCYRPVVLKNTTDEFKKSDWICYTPELICGPDGTKFNKPISVRMKHMLNISENDLSTGDGFTVITKGDEVEKWQEDKGRLTFDGQWINIEVDHFSHIGLGNRRERQCNVDAFLSTSFTENQDANPVASEKYMKPPRPPTKLWLLLSGCESRLKDIKRERYNTDEGEQISRYNYVLPHPINLNADLLIQTIPVSYKLSNGEIIRIDLRNMTLPPWVDSDITHLPDSIHIEDNMIELEKPYQPDPEGQSGTIPCDGIMVKRSEHSHIPPAEDFTINFRVIDNMLRNRQLLRPSRPGRRVISFPIQETMNLPVTPPIETPRQQPTTDHGGIIAIPPWTGLPQNVRESFLRLANQYNLVRPRQIDEAPAHEAHEDSDVRSDAFPEDSDVTSADAHEDSDVI